MPFLSGFTSTATVTRSNSAGGPADDVEMAEGRRVEGAGADRVRSWGATVAEQGVAVPSRQRDALERAPARAGSPRFAGRARHDQVGVRGEHTRARQAGEHAGQRVGGQVVGRVGDDDVERAGRRAAGDATRPRDSRGTAPVSAGRSSRPRSATLARRAVSAARSRSTNTADDAPGTPTPGRARRTRRTGRAPGRRPARRSAVSELASAARTFSDGRPGARSPGRGRRSRRPRPACRRRSGSCRWPPVASGRRPVRHRRSAPGPGRRPPPAAPG